MEWWKIVVCIVVFFWALILRLAWLNYKSEKENRKQEAAWYKWKVCSGFDPTYDEHGRLRK